MHANSTLRGMPKKEPENKQKSGNILSIKVINNMAHTFVQLVITTATELHSLICTAPTHVFGGIDGPV